MSAHSTYELKLFASAFMFTNLVNIVMWSLDFYLSAHLYIVLFIVFFLRQVVFLKKNAILITSLLVLMTILILGYPILEWDPRSIWFFHAKRIFIDNNLYAQLDNYASWSHNDYPIMLPALAASFAKTLGYWNEVFPRLALLPLIFPLLILFSVLIEKRELFYLWIIAILSSCHGLLINGYLDGILGLYFAAASIVIGRLYLQNKEENDQWDLVILVLLLSTLLFLKNEGLLMVCVLSLGILPLLKTNKNYVFIFIMPVFLYVTLWKLHVYSHQITNDLFTPGVVERFLSRFNNSIESILIYGAYFRESFIYLSLLFFMALFGNRFRIDLTTYIPFILTMVYTLGIIVIYFTTPHDLIWHLQTSASRTFMATNVSLVSIVLWCISFNYYKTRIKSTEVKLHI